MMLGSLSPADDRLAPSAVELWPGHKGWEAPSSAHRGVLSRIFSRHSRGSEQCIAPVFAGLRKLGLGHKRCGEFLRLTFIRKRGRLVFARKSFNRLLHRGDVCKLGVDCFQFVSMSGFRRYSTLHQFIL